MMNPIVLLGLIIFSSFAVAKCKDLKPIACTSFEIIEVIAGGNYGNCMALVSAQGKSYPVLFRSPCPKVKSRQSGELRQIKDDEAKESPCGYEFISGACK